MKNDISSIEVPREKPDGKKITKEFEGYLLDLFAKNNEEPYATKELLAKIRRKFPQFGWDVEGHVSWALDMLHANHLIKRVAPGVWEADEGPDDVYSERETGYPEGEFANRGKNFNVGDTSHFKNREEYKSELFKVKFAIKMLKNLGKSPEDIEIMLRSGGTPFNPIAIKLGMKELFQGIEV